MWTDVAIDFSAHVTADDRAAASHRWQARERARYRRRVEAFHARALGDLMRIRAPAKAVEALVLVVDACLSAS